jgi:hypothetical protein
VHDNGGTAGELTRNRETMKIAFSMQHMLMLYEEANWVKAQHMDITILKWTL